MRFREGKDNCSHRSSKGEKLKAAKWRPQHEAAKLKRAANETAKKTEAIENRGVETTTGARIEVKQQHEEESRRAAAERQKEECRIAAKKKEERKEARQQKRKAIRKMKTTENKQEKAEMKTLLEEKEVRAERKQLRAYCKQRAETVEADASSMGIPLEKMEQLT